jgi:hypothetical protein
MWAAWGSDGPCMWAVGVDTSISAACPARPMFLAGFCFSGTPSGWVPGASVWGTPRTYIDVRMGPSDVLFHHLSLHSSDG